MKRTFVLAGFMAAAAMIGLGVGNMSVNYSDIEFAVYLTNGGGVQIYESNVSRGAFGSYGEVRKSQRFDYVLLKWDHKHRKTPPRAPVRPLVLGLPKSPMNCGQTSMPPQALPNGYAMQMRKQ